MRVLAIVNPAARAVASARDPNWPARVERAFEAAGIEVTLVSLDRVEMAGVLALARETGADAVVAGGGDGTIGSVAGALAGHDLPLGVLPLGTHNHFAQDLGIPLSLDGAVAVIAAGCAVAIDVGEVNGHVFVNNSSIGLYPRLVGRRNRIMRRLNHGKWVAALLAAVALFRRYPLMRTRLEAGDVAVERLTPFVFVGNNEYEVDLLRLGSRSRLDRGSLSVYFPTSESRYEILRIALRALTGRLRPGRDFVEILTTAITIEPRRKRARVSADGEVVKLKAPLRYRTRPGALRVLVPPREEGP
jgi:diacylglycerol kinase family enzyme